MDINIQQLLKTTLGQTSQSYDVNIRGSILPNPVVINII